jgi:demethylsterigmatocystin 6-O-methyltransferase
VQGSRRAGYRAGMYNYFDNCGPVIQILPDFLAENHYQDISDETKTPFQKAFPTNMPTFQWLKTQLERIRSMSEFMTVASINIVPWFAVFPFEKELGSFSGPHVLVDVGGGFGQQCANLVSRYPELRAKLVLEDLEPISQQIPPSFAGQLGGVERVPFDLFKTSDR